MKRALSVVIGLALLVSAALLAVGAGAAGASGSSVTLQLWEGYTGVEASTFMHLVKEFESSHPAIRISVLAVDNDYSLQKVLTAVSGGTPPDISYLYGSWAPEVAQIPSVVNLTSVVKQKSVHWDDFWAGERAVATVNGKVIGFPALVDNLAVVYNKKLFAGAHLPQPAADWTWTQFAADAKALTDAKKRQYGWSYITSGTEDTVWHWEAMLWEAGGSLLNSNDSKATFDSKAGLETLDLLQSMDASHSIYFDPTDSVYAQLFNSGKIGMLVTGPWDLASFPNIDYGVQFMPSFPGMKGSYKTLHQTISGPDNWVVFNNGSANTSAAISFLEWLTATDQARYFSLHTGDLPIRQSVVNSQFLTQMDKVLPGDDKFIENLGNVVQARPQLVTYPKISTVLGNMVDSVLLGKSSPEAALESASGQIDTILTTGGAGGVG